ncbi:hypothetical protein TNCV_1186301 [Trichonephila clavipes]|nr:hypothetical protein TNCV_1186301 [Trichonephila clavipes]
MINDYREEITDLVQSISGFQEYNEEVVETWMTCDAEDCGFQMLNDDEISSVSYTVGIAFGFRLFERYPVPIDSDKRRSTVVGF